MLILAFILGFQVVTAQTQKTWQWVSPLGGKLWDITNGLVCDGKNNLAITGTFSDTLFTDNKSISSFGGTDLFLARYNEKGGIIDIIHAGGQENDEASCMAMNKKDEILLGGSVSGNVTFENVSFNVPGKRMFIANISNKGHVNWITTLENQGEASLFLLGADKNGTIYASGIFTGTIIYNDIMLTSKGEQDIFLARLSADGKVEKIVALGGEKVEAPSTLMVSDSGKIYLAGTFSDALSIDTLILKSPLSPAGTNAFIIRLNASLKAEWMTSIAAEEYAAVTAIKEDKSGNIYVTGNFNMEVALEDTMLSTVGYTDVLLLKYNPQGKRLFAKSFGSWYYDYSISLITDLSGGFILTGSLGDTLYIDEVTLYPKSNNSAMILQFSEDGKAMWGDCISGAGRNFSNATAIDKKGNLYLSGSYSGSFEKETLSYPSQGDQDVFLAKYFNCAEVKDAIFGNNVICSGNTTELYVKPGYSHIAWNDSVFDATSLVVTRPGLYSVKMIDKHGCLVEDTIEVTGVRATDFSLGNDIQLPVEGSITLTAPENLKNYLWQDQSSESTLIARAENSIPGKYVFWLSAFDSLGCQVSDTIAFDFYQTTGWVNALDVIISYYPNPVKDWLTWSINTKAPCQLDLELTGHNGKTVYNEHVGYYEPDTEMKLNLGSVPPGIYYLQVKDGSGQGSKTVCIIRQ